MNAERNMRKNARRLNRKERGQALVEAALTMVVCMGLIIGILDVGQALFMYQNLMERARSAARWAAVNTWDATNTPTAVQNLIMYGQTTQPSGQTPAFGLTATNISVTRPTPDYSSSDRILITISGYNLSLVSADFISAFMSNRVKGSFTGLTITAAQTYEISNGSSH